MTHQSAPDVFLSAISSRDFGRLAESMAPQAHARMLLPPGPEVRSRREAIARRFEGWFSRAADFDVLDSHRIDVGPRSRLNSRFRRSRDGRPPGAIAQGAFINVGAYCMSEIDLL